MEFKLYDETPSQQDLFDGQNHSNLADKISSILLMKDINTIGLDGCLGSGKSTVLTLIKKKLKENTKITFIDFDVELYHHGSTKKALINVLYDGMKPKVKDYILKAFVDYKNFALGNKFSYEKHQKSSMSAWTFSFIFTSLLSLQSFRFFLLDLSKLFNNESYSKITLFVESLLLVSPLAVLLLFFLFRDRNNSINFSDIIKKNSLDTITETVLISKEVGALELKSALNGFLKCVDDHTFILIIDNLDRVSKEKVKEIWSDIELITHNSNSKLKIIIPYSAEHLSKSLSDKDNDGNEGMEFLSKRLPVTFRVPPIISTGWRSAFDYFWKETFSDHYTDQSKEISQLIETWLPANYKQVTPRLLKRLINDINISVFTTPKIVSPIAASFYILACRYNTNPFSWATLNYESDNINDFLKLHNISEEYYKKYSLSFPQLQRLYENNKNSWLEDILCLHFQTNENLAKSELISEPLLVAINQGNTIDFFRLTDTFGFDSLWKATLDKTEPTKWIKILSEADDNHLGISQNIINDVVKALNTKELTIEKNTLDLDLIQSLEKLNKRNINFRGVYFTNIRQYIIDAIAFYNESYLNNKTSEIELDKCEAIIKIANSFCILDEDKLVSNYLNDLENLSGDFFANILYEHIEDYTNLKINTLELNDNELINSLNCLTSKNPNFDIFDEFFISRLRVDMAPLATQINTKAFLEAEAIATSLEKDEKDMSLRDANLLVLSNAYHKKNLSNLIISLDTLREEHIVNFLCLLILNSIESKTYDISNIITNNSIDESIFESPKFQKTLSDYLLFSTSFENIIQSLNDTEITNYVAESIKSIIINRKVARLSINSFINKDYSILVSCYKFDTTLSFFSGWDHSFAKAIKDKQKNSIDSMDILFIDDLLESKALPLSHKELIDAAKDKLSGTKDIQSLFIKIESNLKIVIEYCSKNSINLLKNGSEVFTWWFTETPYNEMLKDINSRLIFDILSEREKKSTLDNLTDLIYQRDFDIKKQILLIEKFGDIISLQDTDKKLVNRTIIRLFPYAIESISLSGWLDKQNFNFTRWKSDDKETVQSIILSNPDKFPQNAAKLKKPKKMKKNELIS
ncbi:hypothetical protein BSK71_00135 [Pectobacterium actinidiae]|uniref:KAP NTPase domain-containing protein n=2 Tax=Pectobacterium actinidiae TaxID=1507808 RepID=A0A1V2R8B7_9GAMM|nr:P-loop NTPase fold protein [Pectobacterium actinidiae]KHN90550.1 hypothetical protein KKH3_05770 [Pectobacterium actinidiae]ONK07402.1 hypothetical protein BSK69_02735 [Pectobacterium actinidiae]ONK08680.1 hypothetical protein BSK71_00135 [Pectobacterium actinidiae]